MVCSGSSQLTSQPACTGAQSAHRQLAFVQFPTQMECCKDVEMTWATLQFRKKGVSLQETKHHSFMEDFVSGTCSKLLEPISIKTDC